MARHFSGDNDWLTNFVKYCSYGEAPANMYFWTGVSTIAGALRRKVWIDQINFTWYPSFYIILVAPPGVVSKSTTANMGMNLLREVPGIQFGPDICTMESLVGSFENAKEAFEYDGAFHVMSPLTLAASEFGQLLDTENESMVMLLIDLWDGNKKLDKQTKFSGNNFVEAPWINLIACTTPSWLAANFSEQMVGGGLVSRMIFVYAEKKEKLVAYPRRSMPTGHDTLKQHLIEDLQEIAKLTGEYVLTENAYVWGEEWYKEHWKKGAAAGIGDARLGGYMARKQCHFHKVAMIISASRGDSMKIDAEDLATAALVTTELEAQMPQVFHQIGRTEKSVQVERFLTYLKKRGKCPYAEAYRYIHNHFPGMRDFEDMVAGLTRSRQLRLEELPTGSQNYFLTYIDND